MWMGVGGGQLLVDVHTNKFEPTDVILSSSHAKKFTFFVPEFLLRTE